MGKLHYYETVKENEKMSNTIEFEVIGFKLAVVQILMYDQEVLKPKFDVEKFIEIKRNLKEGEGTEVIEDEGYDIIPEAMAYFEELQIDESLLIHIENLCMDGGDEIYSQIYPYWGGEADCFDVKSLDDVGKLQNLKKFNPVAMGDCNKVDYTPLLQCPNLEFVNLRYCKGRDAFVKKLVERGIEYEY